MLTYPFLLATKSLRSIQSIDIEEGASFSNHGQVISEESVVFVWVRKLTSGSTNQQKGQVINNF